MSNKKSTLFLSFLVLVCVCCITCNFENPIIDKWWVEEEPDPEYIPIIKSVPQLVYQTITEDRYIYETVYEQLPPEVQTVYVDRPVPPEVLLQYITIINIEFIIFSGDSVTYNANSPTNGTNLTQQEKDSNASIVTAMVKELKDNPGPPPPDTPLYLLLLHGHANPVSGTAEEAADLADISLKRANSVAAAIRNEYESGGDTLEPNRITTKGYGGGRNISGSSSSYAGLNRRVEAILITVETEPQQQSGGG